MKNILKLFCICIFSCITLLTSAQGIIYRAPIVKVQPTLVDSTDTTTSAIHKFYNDTLVLDTTIFNSRPTTIKKASELDTLLNELKTQAPAEISATDSLSLPIREFGNKPLVLDTTIRHSRPTMMKKASELDTLLNELKTQLNSADFFKIEADTTIETLPIPTHFFRQPVFCGYDPNLDAEINIYESALAPKEDSTYSWISREIEHNKHLESIKQGYIITHPNKVTYNLETLPIAPKRVFSKIDPRDSKITVQQQDLSSIASNISNPEIKRRYWLSSFSSLLQFSQAYNSPNWYQGGNNNLNMLFNLEYNIKLNEKFHPNLLFDTNIKYKLAMNSAPEDTLRKYSISDDIFQINSKFGVRAAKRWFYSVQGQFKTQLLNHFPTNSNDIIASFLSPGELNVGLGMTYNYANKKKSFTFDTSVSPLSYNMKICINPNINETDFGITEGLKTVSEIGSSGEAKLKWNITHNISLATRLFAFTDYSYFQGDFENTLSFSINRFLSTQINVNLRYDTSVPSDIKWHKLQLKEILSFGFAYSFKNK